MKFLQIIKFIFSDFLRAKYIISLKFSRLIFAVFYSKFYASSGARSVIYKPTLVIGSKLIAIGTNVLVNRGIYLCAVQDSNLKLPKLIIGDGTTIGNYCHIVAQNKVEIGEHVLIADKVYIGDNEHMYENIEIPIIMQKTRAIGSVFIGAGSWIGDNVAIIGCSIGKHCVIGANSVVTQDIPDYSIAVGNPARVIKRYSTNRMEWERYG